MSGAPFAILLALAWFGATNIALSLASAGLGRFFGGARLVDQPVRAARALFALRLLPAAGSLFFTIGVFLPAHWRWEPAVTEESAGYSIALFAIAGAAIVAITIARAARDTRATSGLTRRWRSAAAAGHRLALGFPVFFLADPSPVMSVGGILRPTLFVAEELRAGLTPEELEVSLAHEVAHARAGDNLKRLVAAWSPLPRPCALGRRSSPGGARPPNSPPTPTRSAPVGSGRSRSRRRS